jgi:hypothetical protein
MKKFVSRYRLPFLFVLFGLVISSVLFILRFKTESTPPAPLQVPLELISVFPQEGVQELAFPGTAIIFTFSTNIDNTRSIARITPQIDYIAETNENMLSIRPEKFWVFGTQYNINISVFTADGQELRDINYNFTPTFPSDSGLTE